MATRRAPPAVPQGANLSVDQMREAIPKLERRVKDLNEFEPASIRQRNDPRIEGLEKRLQDTIADVFGHGTVEYLRFQPGNFDNAGYNLYEETRLGDVIGSVTESKERELTNLHSIIALFKEKIEDAGGSPRAKAARTFGELDLEPSIAGAVEKQFADGHYAVAVETACKVLDNMVQNKSAKFDESGVALMQVVFSPKNPILRFNDQTNDSEKSEQLGMMWLYSGAMAALRNPRAHGIVNDHPEQAIEYLSLVSMLAKALARTKR